MTKSADKKQRCWGCCGSGIVEIHWPNGTVDRRSCTACAGSGFEPSEASARRNLHREPVAAARRQRCLLHL